MFCNSGGTRNVRFPNFIQYEIFNRPLFLIWLSNVRFPNFIQWITIRPGASTERNPAWRRAHRGLQGQQAKPMPVRRWDLPARGSGGVRGQKLPSPEVWQASMVQKGVAVELLLQKERRPQEHLPEWRMAGWGLSTWDDKGLIVPAAVFLWKLDFSVRKLFPWYLFTISGENVKKHSVKMFLKPCKAPSAPGSGGNSDWDRGSWKTGFFRLQPSRSSRSKNHFVPENKLGMNFRRSKVPGSDCLFVLGFLGCLGQDDLDEFHRCGVGRSEAVFSERQAAAEGKAAASTPEKPKAIQFHLFRRFSSYLLWISPRWIWWCSFRTVQDVQNFGESIGGGSWNWMWLQTCILQFYTILHYLTILLYLQSNWNSCGQRFHCECQRLRQEPGAVGTEVPTVWGDATGHSMWTPSDLSEFQQISRFL